MNKGGARSKGGAIFLQTLASDSHNACFRYESDEDTLVGQLFGCVGCSDVPRGMSVERGFGGSWLTSEHVGSGGGGEPIVIDGDVESGDREILVVEEHPSV